MFLFFFKVRINFLLAFADFTDAFKYLDEISILEEGDMPREELVMVDIVVCVG